MKKEKKIKEKKININSQGNSVVISETTETILDLEEINRRLDDIQNIKKSIERRNTQLIKEYQEIIEEENELNEILQQITVNEPLERI